ncbi:MerR family transcriptional regulator [Streptomyces sp. NPDC002851]
MRIGELAALAGVTPRTVRHYHQLGLLPEPGRRPNGYREYGLRHAVILARIRRLTELGLGLPEVRDVLADDQGRELVEVLEELDGDLARQEDELRMRRERLHQLLERARAGQLPAEGPVSPGLAELLGAFGSAAGPGHSPSAARDREHLTLLDSLAGPGQRERLFAALRPLADDPEAVARVNALYARLDELADAEPGDPRVGPLAADLATWLPEGFLELLGEQGGERAGADRGDAGAGTGTGTGTFVLSEGFGAALLADFAPAQAEAVRQMLGLLGERVRDRGQGQGQGHSQGGGSS